MNSLGVTRTCPLSLLAIPDEREWDVRKTQEEYMNEGTGTCFKSKKLL